LTEQLINSLEILTAEFLVKESDKMFPPHRILQQFLQTESPTLYPPCWDVLPVGHNAHIIPDRKWFDRTASSTVHTCYGISPSQLL
jgi:hypothetical protein